MNKICTSLEQSKKLMELGIDIKNSDMYYWRGVSLKIGGYRAQDDEDVPAWSLAALLDVLPLEIEAHKQTDGYKVYYYVELYMKHKEKETYLSTERHESLVDACYEMIIKLNERKLLWKQE